MMIMSSLPQVPFAGTPPLPHMPRHYTLLYHIWDQHIYEMHVVRRGEAAQLGPTVHCKLLDPA